jgi:uncharacterized membrane protein YccC
MRHTALGSNIGDCDVGAAHRSAWQMELYRFAEVSIGIAVAVVLTVVWPEREVAPANKT